jgi:hypothetical protein
MVLWLGIITFLAGSLVWYRSREPGARFPGAMARLGLGTGSLGLGTMTMIQPGFAWTVASICFSTIAIILIGSVLFEIRRRR